MCSMHLRVPEGSTWRLPSDQVGGVWVPIVFHVPGTRGNSPGYFFAPVGHRLKVLVRRRAPAALSIACPLSCCIGPITDHVAVWCGYAPSTIDDCFSSPVHQLFTGSFKDRLCSGSDSHVTELGGGFVRSPWTDFLSAPSPRSSHFNRWGALTQRRAASLGSQGRMQTWR